MTSEEQPKEAGKIEMPGWDKAFGHLGFANTLVWADPERDISVALLTTGKLVLGPHLAALWMLLASISRHCAKLSTAEQEERLAAAGML